MAAALEISEKDIIHDLLSEVLKEDLGSGDVTTLSIVPAKLHLRGEFCAKDEGIAAGLEIAHEVFSMFEETANFLPRVSDGEHVSRGQLIAEVDGPARTILSAERTALNIMQRMSGIATETGKFAEVVRGTRTKILDTRKTVPGLRILDKQAVRIGGGYNHRFGLFDMVLIKDNHIIAAGSISEAVRRARFAAPEGMEIEVEVRDLEELEEALQLKVDRIMLDNMTTMEMVKAVGHAGGRTPLEASGNITLERVRELAEIGLDYISVGSLTHSVKALDISLLLDSPGVQI
ncbi:MAG TPA: carboxylating nicotinate-nucleotide diphosphorylase [Spirochaeta sp.]|nr:carboxylating nicotinate-nucleotide diphosphorylase [Spirochaeta sp.]